jgi:transcriptional regulator with XRE-family HTH domain
MNILGKKLKELRIKKGFTQQQLADALKINKSTISMYEKGHRLPLCHFEGLKYELGFGKNDLTGERKQACDIIMELICLLDDIEVFQLLNSLESKCLPLLIELRKKNE